MVGARFLNVGMGGYRSQGGGAGSIHCLPCDYKFLCGHRRLMEIHWLYFLRDLDHTFPNLKIEV